MRAHWKKTSAGEKKKKKLSFNHFEFLKQVFWSNSEHSNKGLLVIALIYQTSCYSDFHLSFRRKKSVGICYCVKYSNN